MKRTLKIALEICGSSDCVIIDGSYKKDLSVRASVWFLLMAKQTI